jgi:hypothetical protein
MAVPAGSDDVTESYPVTTDNGGYIEYPITYQSAFQSALIDTKYTKPNGQMDLAAMIAVTGNKLMDHVDATIGKTKGVRTISQSHDVLYIGSTIYVTLLGIFVVEE